MKSDGRFLARPAKTNKQAMFKGDGPGLHTLGVSFVATEADALGDEAYTNHETAFFDYWPLQRLQERRKRALQVAELADGRHVNASQKKADQMQLAAAGPGAGGQWRPERAPKAGEVIIDKHRGQSGFANTILDCQLQRHGSSYAVGLAAHTCAESTARFAIQLGCHRTLLEDAPSAYNEELMRVATRSLACS